MEQLQVFLNLSLHQHQLLRLYLRSRLIFQFLKIGHLSHLLMMQAQMGMGGGFGGKHGGMHGMNGMGGGTILSMERGGATASAVITRVD